jgi:hypothetical protein
MPLPCQVLQHVVERSKRNTPSACTLISCCPTAQTFRSAPHIRIGHLASSTSRQRGARLTRASVWLMASTPPRQPGGSGANHRKESSNKNAFSRWSGFKVSLPWQKQDEGLQSSSKMKDDEMFHVAESLPQPRSAVIDLLENIGVTNLTDHVTTVSHPPIFKGAFSDVYQGVCEGKLVWCLPLIRHFSLSGDLDCHQGYTHCGF